MRSHTVRQAGVLAIRDGHVCLVTSRSGRRWVIPKGQIDPGHTPPQAAAIEAWEEAGLVGTVDDDPLGSFHYVKYGVRHHVIVYRLRVEQVKSNWPERDQRRREWVPAIDAAERVIEGGLRDLIRAVVLEESCEGPLPS